MRIQGHRTARICGNPVIMTEKFSGALRPDLVIPFKLDKKAAKEAYYKHIKGKTAAAESIPEREPY